MLLGMASEHFTRRNIDAVRNIGLAIIGVSRICTSASDATETCKHIASESSSTGPDPPEVQESENIAIPEVQEPENIVIPEVQDPESIAIKGPNGGDGPIEELYTVSVKMLNGDMKRLQLRREENALKLREYLEDIAESSVPISYTLWLYEENIRAYRVDLFDVIYDVADFYTGQYHLEMVEESFEDQSIMANDHHTGELLSHSSLHSSVARNTSSNLKDGNDGNSSYTVIVKCLVGKRLSYKMSMSNPCVLPQTGSQ